MIIKLKENTSKEDTVKENDIKLYIENPPVNIMHASARMSEGDMNCLLEEWDDSEIDSSVDLRELTEANLNRISRGHSKDGYIVISAFFKDRTIEENNQKTKELKAALTTKGYSYVPVFGGYRYMDTHKETMEKSFCVYPIQRGWQRKPIDFNVFKENMIKLGKKYEQNSILICPPNEKPRYLYLADMHEGKPFSDIIYNDTNQENFTALKKWNADKFNQGKPQRFTYENPIEDGIKELNN